MRIDVILTRWIDVLAAMLLGYRDAWRTRRYVTVRRDAGRVIVSRGEPGHEMILAEFAAAAAAPPAVSRAMRNGLVVLELPPDDVAIRRIRVPAQAREFLSGIVQNQIERLSPWAVQDAVYGFDAKPSAHDPAALDVRVLMTSRAVVETARQDLQAAGLSVDRIVWREADAAIGATVSLWSRLADTSRDNIRRARLTIGGGLAACVVASAGLSLWAFMSMASISDESDDIALRSAKLQRQLQGAGRTPSLAGLDPAQRAWLLKETMPSAVMLVEALSRALPDAAHLTELHLDNTTVRAVGLASDPPSLIAPLEKSHVLTDVHFFGPTTRGRSGKAFQFHIEARIDPRAKLAED